MTLRFRAKPYATGALILYVNGKTAGETRLTAGDGFGNYEIEIACERYPARASLRPLYDPKSERVRS